MHQRAIGGTQHPTHDPDFRALRFVEQRLDPGWGNYLAICREQHQVFPTRQLCGLVQPGAAPPPGLADQ
ncbi:hypothetical protein D3C75_1048200 [compost metagenome]